MVNEILSLIKYQGTGNYTLVKKNTVSVQGMAWYNL